MEENKTNTVPMGIRFMGRSLGELLELKAKCRRRLAFLDKNKTRISAYVYEKLRLEYQSYLDAVDGEVSVRLCDYEVKLAEIRVFSNQLELLKKSFSDRIQEIRLRFSLGEYDRQKYEQFSGDYKNRMEQFEQGIVKYSGEQQRIRQFLDQVYGDGSTALERMTPEIGMTPEPETAAPLKEPAKPAAGAGPAGQPQEDKAAPPVERPAAPPVSVEREELQRAPEPEEPLTGKPAASLLERVGTGEPAGLRTPESATGPEDAEEEGIDLLAEDDTEPEIELDDFDLPDRGESAEPPVEPGFEMGPEQSPVQETVEELPGLQEIRQERQPDIIPEAETEPVAGTEAEKAGPVRQEEPVLEAADSDDLEEIMLGAGEAKPVEEETAGPAESPEVYAEPAAEPEAEQDLAAVGETSREQSAGPLEEPVAEAPAAPAADLEANLSADLEKDLAERAEPSRPAAPAAEGTLDLDAIMSAAGTGTINEPEAAAGPTPAKERQAGGSPDNLAGEAKEIREPEVESEPGHDSAEEDFDLETEIRLEPVETEQTGGNGRGEEQDAQAAGEADWVREEEYPVEEPADGEEMGETPEPPARRALSLDERLELSLDVERMDDESQALSVNQTIDAIKKKTVKCPSCGTMNYAIRWYCENCEATLTTL